MRQLVPHSTKGKEHLDKNQVKKSQIQLVAQQQSNADRVVNAGEKPQDQASLSQSQQPSSQDSESV